MKVVLIACSCDLPARALVLNMNQFNGFHGCWYCMQPGETLATGKGGHVHIYPHDNSEMHLRDVDSWREHSKSATPSSPVNYPLYN